MHSSVASSSCDDTATLAHDGLATIDERPTPAPAPAPPRRKHRRASAPLEFGARYELGEVIGRGGMGEVLAAYDVQVGREVAIKRLRPDRISPLALARFWREARIQGRLDHPAIPAVHELGCDDEARPFFVMKKLSGTTLSEILRDPDKHAQFSQQRLLRAFAEICLAIEFAHSRGVVHRDLKPANILLGEFGEVYVLDWGVARVLEESESSDLRPTRTTLTGVAVGTPGYMAPEQVRGDPDLDARADVYTLGCVLFEILTGQRRHPRGEAGLQSALAGTVARPSTHRDETPPELDELCVRATMRDRDARIGSARALGEAVQRYLDGDRDIALRQLLARRHLAEARSAWNSTTLDDEARRRTAMREAGRALALDPTLTSAAELVGRLMMEPPKELPQPVVTEVEASDAKECAAQARLALAIYSGFMGLTLIFVMFGIRDPGYLAAHIIVPGLSVLLAWITLRRGRPVSRTLVALANAALLALTARMFTPFLLAPGICAVTVMAYALHPGSDRRSVLFAAIVGLASIFAVWAVEALGWLSPTMQPLNGDIQLSSPLDGIESFPAIPALIFFSIALTAVAGGLAYSVSRRAREAHRRLHMQGWQLRQLLSLPAVEVRQ